MKEFLHLLILLVLCSTQAYAQPANDDPCAAVSIPVLPADPLGYNCEPSTTYSWAGATLTAATPNPGCLASNQSNIRDVWYKIVVPASGRLQITMSASFAYYYVLYDPATCSNTISFVQRFCAYYAGSNVNSVRFVTGLTPGTTMYLRLMRTTEAANASGSVLLCIAESLLLPAIDNSKRIGIGTNTPLAKLDVVGTAIIRDSLLVDGSIRSPGIDGSIAKVGSIYSSPWITSPYAQRDTTVDGTCFRLRQLDVPLLTNAVLNSKLITVYFRIGSIGPFQLPYISDAGGVTNQVNCFFKEGKIFVYRHTFDNCRFTSAVPEAFPGQPLMINIPQSLEYRYVIHD